jgi:hypothetical protein
MLMMDGYIYRFLRSDVAIRAKHLTKMRIAGQSSGLERRIIVRLAPQKSQIENCWVLIPKLAHFSLRSGFSFPL